MTVVKEVCQRRQNVTSPYLLRYKKAGKAKLSSPGRANADAYGQTVSQCYFQRKTTIHLKVREWVQHSSLMAVHKVA